MPRIYGKFEANIKRVNHTVPVAVAFSYDEETEIFRLEHVWLGGFNKELKEYLHATERSYLIQLSRDYIALRREVEAQGVGVRERARQVV